MLYKTLRNLVKIVL